LDLAKSLSLNGKANLVKRIGRPKPGKTEKRPVKQIDATSRSKANGCHSKVSLLLFIWVGQNRTHPPYMTIYLVISLP